MLCDLATNCSEQSTLPEKSKHAGTRIFGLLEEIIEITSILINKYVKKYGCTTCCAS